MRHPSSNSRQNTMNMSIRQGFSHEGTSWLWQLLEKKTFMRAPKSGGFLGFRMELIPL